MLDVGYIKALVHILNFTNYCILLTNNVQIILTHRNGIFGNFELDESSVVLVCKQKYGSA